MNRPPAFHLRRAGLALLLSAAPFSTPAVAGPQSEEKLSPQAEIIEGVLVPVPEEIFGIFDSYTEPNWGRVQRTSLVKLKPAGSQVRIALRLGSVIAEGFVAVAAQDPVEVREVGRAALTLARALGIERSILRRSNSILDYSEKGNWKAVRAEWSNIEADVRAAMLEIDSAPLAQLVSAGGWLRGTEALSALAGMDYSESHAAVLVQPKLLEYLEIKLSAIKGELKDDPLIAVLQKGIGRLKSLISTSTLSKDSVKEINGIARDLLKEIEKNPLNS